MWLKYPSRKKNPKYLYFLVWKSNWWWWGITKRIWQSRKGKRMGILQMTKICPCRQMLQDCSGKHWLKYSRCWDTDFKQNLVVVNKDTNFWLNFWSEELSLLTLFTFGFIHCCYTHNVLAVVPSSGIRCNCEFNPWPG